MTDSTIPAPGASPCEIRTFRSTTRPLPVWFRLSVVSPGYVQLVALGPIAVAVTIPSLGRIGGAMLIARLGGMMEGVGRVLARCLFEAIRPAWSRGRSRKVGFRVFDSHAPRSRPSMNEDRRRTFKLRDLMVAVFVVAVLLSLPLSQMFDSSTCNYGRVTQCQNNMKQIALGLMGFANAKGAFPNAGTFFDHPAVHGGDPERSQIRKAFVDPHGAIKDPLVLLRSWVVDILPYIDGQELYNDWNFQAGYLSEGLSGSSPGNATLGDTPIGILRCPDDNTAVYEKGNLSYAVNGGFARWPALPVAWEGSEIDGMSSNGGRLNWAPKGGGWQESQAVGKKLGVMFLGTHTGGQPWDIRTSAADISDGANSTILVSENRLTGYSAGESPYSGHQPTNWACPLPNFAMIFGSDEVCRSAKGTADCLAGQLAPRTDGSPGIGWKMANRNDTHENVGGSDKLRFEGSYPFSNAHHTPFNSLFWSGSGANYAFCDGSVRFITNTIDGDVYARILTPAGASLPPNLRQAPFPAEAFEP